MAVARDIYNQHTLGGNLNDKLKKSRVLMVGAGGIGCELLKNLVLSGFQDVHIVDLDTIDLSNLNRQFLFRNEHIKKSKALVAKEVAQSFNPDAKITAYHSNIKETQFGVAWLRQFDLAFNALDNLEARRHVNKMCLASDIPLIESGTTGFNGQVQVIKKGVTACYDCSPKETPKSFPVCTIRSTPSEPIHCIVWAKSYLLNEIFGTSEDGSSFDNTANAENAGEIEELKREAIALRRIRDAVGTAEFPRMLFEKVFQTDVERLRSMPDMWKSRKPPEPLNYDDLVGRAPDALAAKDSLLHDGQKVWSLEESLVVFQDSLDRLSQRISKMREGMAETDPAPIIEFDKDDQDTLDFVASSSNIRSAVFGIDRKSRFDVKQMAGNIIPAIATTNAIVAGLCILQAFKVIKGELDKAKEVFLTPFAPARLLATDRSRAPNPNCPVCSTYQTSAFVDLSRATLSDLVEDFVRLGLGYAEKEFSVNSEAGLLYDVEETENLGKKLSDLGVHSNSFITVMDEDEEEPFIDVVINIQASSDPAEKPIKGLGADRAPEIPRKPKVEVANGTRPTNGEAESNGVHAPEPDAKTLKRARPDDDEEVVEPKKAKKVQPEAEDDDDVVLVEDEGAILIDDD